MTLLFNWVGVNHHPRPAKPISPGNGVQVPDAATSLSGSVDPVRLLPPVTLLSAEEHSHAQVSFGHRRTPDAAIPHATNRRSLAVDRSRPHLLARLLAARRRAARGAV